MDPREKLQELEIPIRGMELAMTSGPSFPVIVIDEEFKDVLNSLKAEIGLKLEQAKCFATLKAPGSEKECIDKSLWTLINISSTEDVPASFFYCVQLLQDGWPVATNAECIVKETEKTRSEESSDSRNQIKLWTQMDQEQLVHVTK